MIAPRLVHDNVRLIEPDVERDTLLSMRWLEGEAGRKTLQAMGVPDADIAPPTVEQERARIQSFLDRTDQLNWMIADNDQVIGSVWVDLEPTEHVQAPGVHIMIGDSAARGKGIGPIALRLVLDYLHQQGYESVYSRHRPSNSVIARVNESLGLVADGPEYTDEDGLRWQNTVHRKP